MEPELGIGQSLHDLFDRLCGRGYRVDGTCDLSGAVEVQ